MKIKIDEWGCLQIERDGKWKRMECAHRDGVACSDYCPLFGELEEWENGEVALSLCDCKLLHGTIEDLRGKG